MFVSTLTVVVRSLAQCHEVHDGVVHLQHGDGLAVHDGQRVPPARLVVREASGEDDERLAVAVRAAQRPRMKARKMMQKRRIVSFVSQCQNIDYRLFCCACQST